jgi:hypothetical protein
MFAVGNQNAHSTVSKRTEISLNYRESQSTWHLQAKARSVSWELTLGRGWIDRFQASPARAAPPVDRSMSPAGVSSAPPPPLMLGATSGRCRRRRPAAPAGVAQLLPPALSSCSVLSLVYSPFAAHGEERSVQPVYFSQGVLVLYCPRILQLKKWIRSVEGDIGQIRKKAM